MALLMDGMPKPRGQRNEDNLLGMSGDIGMTDSSFQGMGRAPVDELWAGRFSASVDDEDFEDRRELAAMTRDSLLKDKSEDINQIWWDKKSSGENITMEQAEMIWMNNARDQISNVSGLDLYPGHLRSDEENPTFMTEFSDEGASWRDGAMDQLRENGTSKPVFLGDILQHDELYNHYPEAQFMPVYADNSMGPTHGGTYYPQNMFEEGSNKKFGQIILNGNHSDETNLGTMIHELQHFIQSQEGWEGGGSINHETTGGFLRDQVDYGNEDNSPLTKRQKGRIDDAVAEAWEQSKGDQGLFYEALGDMGLDYEAYAAQTGEALARDAEHRWADDAQVDNYYRGDEARWDNENWYDIDSSFIPNKNMPEIREFLQDRGLLGPLPNGFTPEILELIQEEKSKKMGPISRRDPYLKEYMSLLEAAK